MGRNARTDCTWESQEEPPYHDIGHKYENIDNNYSSSSPVSQALTAKNGCTTGVGVSEAARSTDVETWSRAYHDNFTNLFLQCSDLVHGEGLHVVRKAPFEGQYLLDEVSPMFC